MSNVDLPRAEEIIDNLVTLLDSYDFTTLPALERIDAYRDSVRSARNRNSITGEQYTKEHWDVCQLRNLFNKSIGDAKNIYRTPIIGTLKLVDPEEEK